MCVHCVADFLFFFYINEKKMGRKEKDYVLDWKIYGGDTVDVI